MRENPDFSLTSSEEFERRRQARGATPKPEEGVEHSSAEVTELEGKKLFDDAERILRDYPDEASVREDFRKRRIMKFSNEPEALWTKAYERQRNQTHAYVASLSTDELREFLVESRLHPLSVDGLTLRAVAERARSVWGSGR
jgi:hypothetical protein